MTKPTPAERAWNDLALEATQSGLDGQEAVDYADAAMKTTRGQLLVLSIAGRDVGEAYAAAMSKATRAIAQSVKR